MNKFASAIALLGAMLPLGAANAATLRVDLSGYVYFNTQDVAAQFPYGTTVTAWFKYDTEAPGQPYLPGGVVNPNVTLYDNAPIAGAMRVGDYDVTFSDRARMWVTNNEQAGDRIIDRILFDDHYPMAGDVAGRSIDAISWGWQDASAQALDDMLLPTSQATFDRIPDVRGSIDWTPYIGAQHRISFAFTSVMVSQVPEPHTWGLLILGFGVIGYSARRKGGARFNRAVSNQVPHLLAG